jgi:hypothetical protein
MGGVKRTAITHADVSLTTTPTLPLAYLCMNVFLMPADMIEEKC